MLLRNNYRAQASKLYITKTVMGKYILQVGTALLVLLFMYTGVSKLADLPAFRISLIGHPFPSPVLTVIKYTLPPVEIVVALLLLSTYTKTFALYCSAVLMVVFTTYTALIYFHVFNKVPCSCGGVISKMSWGTHVLFNILFTAIAIAALVIQKRKYNTATA